MKQTRFVFKGLKQVVLVVAAVIKGSAFRVSESLRRKKEKSDIVIRFVF
jgi:hypothetical protein